MTKHLITTAGIIAAIICVAIAIHGFVALWWFAITNAPAPWLINANPGAFAMMSAITIAISLW
jgi:hypothetical protein